MTELYLSRAHALVSCSYNYITISISILVSRAAPPARKQRVQVVAFNERQEQLRKYSNASIGTEKHFLGEFLVLLVSMREHNTKKKERSKQREKEREREKEKEKES